MPRGALVGDLDVLRAQFNAEEPVPAKESRAAMDETAQWFRRLRDQSGQVTTGLWK